MTTAAFSATALTAATKEAGLLVPTSTIGALVAALRAGKHVIVTGPPGTGKSTLAQTVARVGQEAVMCTGSLSATATSAWTVADTVGYGFEGPEGRAFRPGVVTQAIQSGRWLIIDELNRADVDRAFGELFAVLAGQSTVLPWGWTNMSPPISIVPQDCDTPEHTDPIRVPRPWRIVATMNTSDRGLLFDLSRALMRRFAFVRLSCPDDGVYRDLLAGAGSIVDRLLPLRDVQDIGPAAFIDAADVVATRLEDGCRPSLALLEAFTAYVVPQLEPIDERDGSRLLRIIDDALEPRDHQAARTILCEFGVLRPEHVRAARPVVAA